MSGDDMKVGRIEFGWPRAYQPETDRKLGDPPKGAMSKYQELEAQLIRVKEERDLAVAHDWQPYPTAWAYSQACRTIERKRLRIAELEAEVKRLQDAAVPGLSEVEKL
ncbi:MAG: hypothetical protein JRL30_00960 [Deltaproteobacteria bacterium]|nr:hypothetical protein [Deltaproteobacteria bacterium]